MELNQTANRDSGSLDALVSLGDYVLATKYSDCDPGDPWRVGYVVRIITDKRGETYIVGNHDGTWNDFREYNHCRKITPEQGWAWIEANGGAKRPEAGKEL